MMQNNELISTKENHLDIKGMLAEVEQEIAKLQSVADALRGIESKPN